MFDKIRAILWLDLYRPAKSAILSWWRLRQYPTTTVIEGDTALGADEWLMLDASIDLAGTVSDEDIRNNIVNEARDIFRQFVYKRDDIDFQRSPRLIYTRHAARENGLDCEDFAGLAAHLFAAAGISGHVITLIRRKPGSWRTLWTDIWEGHAVWLSTDETILTSNNNIYHTIDSPWWQTPEHILWSWRCVDYIPIHRKVTP